MFDPIPFICRTLADFDDMLRLLNAKKKLTLFGAGIKGRNTLAMLKKRGSDVVCFIDSDPSKTNEFCEDIPIVSLQDFMEHHKNSEILITCTHYGEIIEILKNNNIDHLLRGVVSTSFPLDKKNIDANCRLGSDGRVSLPFLEIDIISACNLKCNLCAFFCYLRQGFSPTDDVTDWIINWSKKINPRAIRILGGEPLLHPGLEKIVFETRKNWPAAEIQLITNGLLLEKASYQILDRIKNTGTCIHISRHLNHAEYNEKLTSGIKRLEKFAIPYLPIAAYEQWEAYYQIDKAGNPRPFRSNPDIAFATCHQKNCFTLYQNRFHRCSFLTNAKATYEEGCLSSDWNFLKNEKLLPPETSPEIILEHIQSGPFQCCRMCPERIKRVQATQKTSSKTSS